MLKIFANWPNVRLLQGTDSAKAHLLTNYIFSAVVFGIIYSIFYLYIGFNEGFYITCIYIILLILLPLIFRKTTNNALVANLFLTIVWLIIISLGSLTGGLYSNITPWLAFIIITAVLLTNLKNAVTWLAITIMSISWFYLLAKEPLANHLSFHLNFEDIYYSIGYVGLCMLVFTTSYLFQDERMKYVDQLEVQGLYLEQNNNELKMVKTSLESRNRELQKANKEIFNQDVKIREVNDYLEELVNSRTKELERRNLQLEEYAHMNAHELRAPICTIIGLFNLVDHPSSREEDLPDLMNKLKISIKELNLVTQLVTKIVDV